MDACDDEGANQGLRTRPRASRRAAIAAGATVLWTIGTVVTGAETDARRRGRKRRNRNNNQSNAVSVGQGGPGGAGGRGGDVIVICDPDCHIVDGSAEV